VAYFLALGFEPDAVVCIDGFNEVAIGNQNAAAFAAHPMHPSLAHWGHLELFGRADAEMLDRMAELRRLQERARTLVSTFRTWRWSAVAGRLYLASIYDARERQVRAHTGYSRAIARRGRELGLLGPEFDGDFDAVLDLSVRCWAESSRSLAAICGVHGIQYVHALQPTLLDVGSKPPTDAERAVSGTLDAWARAVPPGYPRLRTAGDELRAAGVHFVDASMAFEGVEETLYFDACHFGPAGSALLAEAIAAALLEGLPAAGRVW
jgi:hypothetical protein